MPVFNKILVVDDNQIDLVIARAVIRNFKPDATIITLNTAEQALHLLAGEQHCKMHPDLILLDIDMPELCGMRLMEQLCLHPGFNPGITVVYFLTANTDHSIHEKALSINGVRGLLPKPLTSDLFAGLLKEYQFSNEIRR
jgi:CheY-like chemotaxis protein